MTNHKPRVLKALAEWGADFESENNHDEDVVWVLGELIVTVGDLRFALGRWNSVMRDAAEITQAA